jgi:hypothetical protein
MRELFLQSYRSYGGIMSLRTSVVLFVFLCLTISVVPVLKPHTSLAQNGTTFTQQDRDTNPLRPVLPAELNRIGVAPFDIYARSTLAFIDIDNDGDYDAFGSGDFEDLEALGRPLSYYKNVGTPQTPRFVEQTYTSDNPFVEQPDTARLLSGAVPAFADMDGDGDPDMLVGGQMRFPGSGVSNPSGIFYYENTGSASEPRLELQIDLSNPAPLIETASIYYAPALADLDGDGDNDLLLGEDSSTDQLVEGARVLYYENTGDANAFTFEQRTGDANPFEGITVPSHSSPGLVDMDNDNDLDLFVGELSGTISYWENVGSATAPDYLPRYGTQNPLSGFDLGDQAVDGEEANITFGNAKPAFVDIDSDGDQDAFSGEYSGYFNFWENVPEPAFPGVPIYHQRIGLDNPFGGVALEVLDPSLNEPVRTAPAFVDLDGDGDQDFVLGSRPSNAPARYYENTGTNDIPRFVWRTGADAAFLAPLANEQMLAFADMDGDGDPDSVTVSFGSRIPVYWENTGSRSAPQFVQANPNPLGDLSTVPEPGTSSAEYVAIADIDADNDLDVFVAFFQGYTFLYENTGSPTAPAFALQGTVGSNPLAVMDVADAPQLNHTIPAPAFVDLDDDGDYDVLQGLANGNFRYFENTGTPQAFSYTEQTTHPFANLLVWLDARPTFTNLDGDDDQDLFVGDLIGRISYFRNGEASTPPNAAPTDIVLSSTGIDEGQPAGTAVGRLSSIDLNLADTHTYSLVAGDGDTDNAAFTIDGRLLQAAESFDVTAQDRYRIRVQTDDGNGGTFERAFTIQVNQISAVRPFGFVARDRDANPLRPVLPAELNRFPVTTENAFNFGFDLYSDSTIAFVDIDNDGDADAFGSGVFGDANALGRPLSYYENVGDADNPLFVEKTYTSDNPFVEQPDTARLLSKAAPAFADLDDDGDQDMLVGGQMRFPGSGVSNPSGVFYYENTGSASEPRLELQIDLGNPAPLIDTPSIHYAPELADIDGDGDSDLVIGQDDGDGVSYWENTSTTDTLAFAERTGADDPFSSVGAVGNSYPALGDLDGDNDLDLVVGSENGRFAYWENEGNATAPSFTERSGAQNPLDGFLVGDSADGEQATLAGVSAPTLVDIDNDGDLDTFSGEQSGYYNFFANTGSAAAPTFEQRVSLANPFGGAAIGLGENAAESPALSSPAFVDMDGDSDQDFVLGSDHSGVPARYYENTGSAESAAYVLRSDAAFFAPLADEEVLAFGDMDRDGDLDAVTIGLGGSTLSYWENTGSSSAPQFAEITPDPFGGVSAVPEPAESFFTYPALVDIDGDADLDVLAGFIQGYTFLYENTSADGVPQFTLRGTIENNPLAVLDLRGDSGAAPAAADLDQDGDYDLVIGTATAAHHYYENIGTATDFAFREVRGASNPFAETLVWFDSRPALVDIDNDGDQDAFMGQRIGRISFFENTSEPTEIEAVRVAGPATTTARAATTFRVVRDPLTVATYTWTPEPDAGQGTANATYIWSAPGEQSVSVAVTNAATASELSDTFTITVEESAGGQLYLPLIVR